MAVINDNGPEESWDTGATYIIPSHQSMHLCGLFSANQHTIVRHKKKTPTSSALSQHTTKKLLVRFFMGLVDDS
ncbi:hypothetical protein DVA81_19280 [Acinetobacter baumannii]|nr:hypothetical protein DVA81_19280 [Acinetobacter baumannii]